MWSQHLTFPGVTSGLIHPLICDMLISPERLLTSACNHTQQWCDQLSSRAWGSLLIHYCCVKWVCVCDRRLWNCDFRHMWFVWVFFFTIWCHLCVRCSVSAAARPRCTGRPLRRWSTRFLQWVEGKGWSDSLDRGIRSWRSAGSGNETKTGLKVKQGQ